SPTSMDSWATMPQRMPITQRSPMTRARGGTGVGSGPYPVQSVVQAALNRSSPTWSCATPYRVDRGNPTMPPRPNEPRRSAARLPGPTAPCSSIQRQPRWMTWLNRRYREDERDAGMASELYAYDPTDTGNGVRTMWCTRCGEEVEDRAAHASICAGASAAARPGAPPPPVMPPSPPPPGPGHRPPPADPPSPPPFQPGEFPPPSPEREHVLRAWRHADSPLVSVTARHSQYQVEDITVEVHVDGRLTVTDGAAHVRPGSGFGGQTPTTSAGLSADAELWALAEQVAFRPPPDPPGPPPPGSPGESLVLRRADGSEW